MPIGIDLPFGSELHNKILEGVRARWQLARDKSSHRYEKWRKSEEQFLSYIRLSEKDRLRKDARENQGQPQYVTLEIPYSYAQLLAAHTYDCSVFLARSPVHQYQGRYAETEDSVQALEALVDYQVNVGKMLVPYYIWLMDRRKYGCGVIGTYWDRDTRRVSEIVEQKPSWGGIPLPLAKPRKVKQVTELTVYEGNKVYNVRPYDFIFDPRVTLGNFQKGEFAGRYSEVGWNHVARKAELGEYQNVEKLEQTKPSNWWREQGSSQLVRPNQDGNEGESIRSDQRDPSRRLGYVELCELFVELVPSDWGLSASRTPEKWLFVVGNDAVVLQARPMGLWHDEYPFDVLEYEVEGYGLFKRSMLEVLQPLNDTVTWLFNTHFYNVRKVLNDQLIADPSRIVLSDLEDPDAGRIIRLRPEAYGQDVRTMVSQLQVIDITQNHLRDAVGVMDMMQRMAGANDNAMGALNSGGRKTATEVRQSNTAAIGRLKTEAEFASAQGWAAHSQKLVQQTQQFYNGQLQLRVAGSLMMRARKLMTVDRGAIAGFFDFVPVDGTLPIDRYAQAALWKDIMTQMASLPSLMMQYDLGAIFEHVAQLAGIKNVQSFKLQLSPDQVLANQLAAGNVLPIGGKGGKRGAGRQTTGADGTPVGPAPVAPVAGMGPPG